MPCNKEIYWINFKMYNLHFELTKIRYLLKIQILELKSN